MHVAGLTVTNLRCLERLDYAPGPGLNLIWGSNGSGKTSLLEALSITGLGKSFLTSRSADLVRHGARGMSVKAVTVDASGSIYEVSVRKERAQTQILLDGQPVLAASALAHHLPVLVFNSQAADLLTESPSNRRALLDRTMFHVEPGYVEVWKRYRQALKQRNELVRIGRKQELGYWNEQLVHLATVIDVARREVVRVVNAALEKAPALPKLGSMSFDYHAGWSGSRSLAEQLEQSWTKDVQSGFTTVGCHRADLAFRSDGRGGSRRLSRGQAKLIVCIIVAALAEFIRERRSVSPVMLVDDLAAELDDMMRGRAVDIIVQANGQCFFTAIKPQDLPEISGRADTVFHVEPDLALITR